PRTMAGLISNSKPPVRSRHRSRDRRRLRACGERESRGAISCANRSLQRSTCPRRHLGGTLRPSCNLLLAQFCRSRWTDELRNQPPQFLSPSCALCRAHSKRRESRGTAGLAAGQIRTFYKPQHRARALRIQVPPTLLAIADELIE